MSARRWMWTALAAVTLSACQCGETPCGAQSTPGQVCIAGGTFRMGHAKLPMVVTEGAAFNPAPENTWYPEHTVSLHPFHLDIYEVTWARYRPCVEAGICSRDGIDAYPSTSAALTDPSLAELPAIHVSYDDAVLFCAWEGKRLPTEAEWERAARGRDGRDYPWGSEQPSAELLAAMTGYSTDVGSWRPDPVGSHPQDVTPEGVHDLFASVYEWVSDWYDPDAYGAGDAVDNPTGPPGPVYVNRPHEYGWGNWITATGERVVRGDRWNHAGDRAWDTEARGAPVWFRSRRSPTTSGVGFRCASDDAPATAPPMPRYPRPVFRPHRSGGAR